MLNDWFNEVRFAIPWETFRGLPRHPAYRYQYRNGECVITPRPRYFHGFLKLPLVTQQEADAGLRGVEIHPLQDKHHKELSKVFASAFLKTVPFSHLSEESQCQSAEKLLTRTWRGEDGVLLTQASHIATDGETGDILGAIVVTLLPGTDFTDFTKSDWQDEAPRNAAESGWGTPHLTWVFVRGDVERRGVGACLLRHASEAIANAGYSILHSTMLRGNEVSLLWHWRMGFQLHPQVYP